MFPYLNNESLLQVQNLPAYGSYYTDNSLVLIPSNVYDVTGTSVLTDNNLEIHVYDLIGNRLTGTQNATSWSYVAATAPDTYTYDINIELDSTLSDLGIERGQYYVAFNLQKPVIGNYTTSSFYINTISPSKTELRLSPIDSNNTQFQQQFSEFINEYNNLSLYGIDDINRIYPEYDPNVIKFGTAPGANVQGYYLDSILLRFSYDFHITNNVSIPLYYDGTTPGQVPAFVALFNNAYDAYINNDQRALLLTGIWFKGANIKMTLDTLFQFRSEINAFRSLPDNALTIPQLTAIYNDATQLKEFWTRNSDYSYKHLGEPYFNNNGTTGTLAKAGYVLAPNVYPSDYILNFGNNNIVKIINVVLEAPYNILVKLASPLSTQYQELDTLWLAKELTTPLIDKILLVNNLQVILGTNIKGPNFNIDVHEAQSIATSLQSWNDLLSANVNTNQQIINKYFSGSLSGIHLNINYGEFKNFIHFSSAEERVANFQYKLQLIEHYTDRLNTINNVTGSIGANILEASTKRDNIVGGFDDFEKYLFYNTTGSLLYTFASCSIQPWPKQNVSNSLIDYSNQVSVTSSIAETYYNDLLEQAQIFDRFNIHSLRNTIPVHIKEDQFNAEYILFVDMIGHFYDIIWSYINQLTQINTREEHPFDGMAQDLIYDVAKSLGVSVYNGRSGADLWGYVLGVDSNGEFIQSGSLTTLPTEQTTKEVWRRVVNNLPFLYKTKGTARSIKALLTCYGIPTTILNIKEYGGVAPEENDLFPYYVHDVFNYAHVATGSSSNYVITPWQAFTRTFYDESPNVNQYPDAIEFRFRTDDNFTYDIGTEYSLLRSDVDLPVTASVWSQIQNQWAQYNIIWSANTPSPSTIGDPFFEVTFKKTDSDNGSLKFYLSGSNGWLSSSIDNIYMFDNNWITGVVQRNQSTDSLTEPSQSFTLKYQKGLYGKIVASGSSTINVTTNNSGSYNNSWITGSYITWGNGGNNIGITGGTSDKFYGLYQEFRYWYDNLIDSSISNHTLSPNSYNGNYHYSAYHDLAFRTSLSRKDLVVNGTYGYMQQLSQHPNQSINTNISSIFVDRPTLSSVPFEGVEETYYTLYADLTAHVIYSEKIRIESQSLSGPLSIDERVTKSSFDNNSVDSNKLGIYFSPQNGINEDIVNHLGYLSLDDYIGDPRDQYEPTYNALSVLQNDYWKKYTNKNDFNTYFRALQIYDLSVFRQIKKFVPARANLISGIVVEPNLLERNKANWVKTPVVENLAIGGEVGITSDYTVLSGIVNELPDAIIANVGNNLTGSYIPVYIGNTNVYTVANNVYSIAIVNSDTNLPEFGYIAYENLLNDNVYESWYLGAQNTGEDGPPVTYFNNGVPQLTSGYTKPVILGTNQFGGTINTSGITPVVGTPPILFNSIDTNTTSG